MHDSTLNPLKRTNKACLNPSDVMAILGLGRTVTYRELRKGNIPSIRMGKKRIIPRVALENWLASGGKVLG